VLRTEEPEMVVLLIVVLSMLAGSVCALALVAGSRLDEFVVAQPERGSDSFRRAS
jgi:hypothetical protein